ncbi:12833_t:CDS:1 [Ambispora gerdemannii]|uniref:12833_t:CDS:1 n=1 Tax=Ambispora gerdemannii TaxID=144530 RepID=A0A9N8YVH3_9GLOM|nr:12833_t:CDS:1 [Ambispora gerdemannii]
MNNNDVKKTIIPEQILKIFIDSCIQDEPQNRITDKIITLISTNYTNDEKPTKLFQLVAQKCNENHSKYFVLLGFFHAYGFGAVCNEAEAFKWYLKAAEHGDPIGQLRVAAYFESGIGKNISKSRYWFEKAASTGLAIAQYRLARNLRISTEIDNDDISNSIFWLEKSATAGFDKGIHVLAWIYGRGKGVPKDLKKSLHWYRKLEDSKSGKATKSLVMYYLNGLGTAKDKHEAIKYLYRALKSGVYCNQVLNEFNNYR